MNDWLLRISPCPRVIGGSTAPRGWIEPLRVIYDHELVLFAGGTCLVEIGADRFECPPESFIIVPPGRLHVSRQSGPAAVARSWVHFDWSYQGPIGETPVLTYHPGPVRPELYRPAPAFVPKTILHGPIASPSAAFDLHQRLQSRWNSGGRHDRLAARGLLLELLVELLDRSGEPPSSRPEGDPIAARVRRRLDQLSLQPFREAVSIQSALEQLGCSYAHACRRFKRAYGLSPLAYLSALRVERAKLLLRDSDLTVAQIAQRLGFDNVGYFIRRFRRQTALSPRAFARRQRP